MPAQAETSDDPSQGQAELINLDALGLDVLDGVSSRSGFPTSPEGEPQNVDLEVLGALGVTLPGIGLPLIGEDGLIDVGGDTLGAAGTWAQSPSEYESNASVGLIGGDGALNTNVADLDGYDYMSLDLAALVNNAGVPTEGVIDSVALELGAIASEAEVYNGEVESSYSIAGAQLSLDAPILGNVTGALDETVDALDVLLAGLAGDDGIVQGVLDTVDIDVTIPLLLSISTGEPTVAVNSDLDAVTAGLLEEPIASESGLVAIDLSTGEVLVDLEMIMEGDNGLNGLAPNTDLLSEDNLNRIVSELNTLLTEDLLSVVTGALEEALLNTEVVIDLNPQLSSLGGLLQGDITATVEGTLGQLAGVDDVDGSDLLNVSGGVTVGFIPVPLGDIIGALTTPVVNQLLPALLAPLAELVLDADEIIGDTIGGVTAPVFSAISPVLEVLTEVATVRINDQPTERGEEGNLGEGSFSVSALSVELLQLGTGAGAISLPLATSSVLAQEADAELTAEPDVLEPGQNTTVDGAGWIPGNEVTAEATGPDGFSETIALDPASVDEDGTFTFDWTAPEDAEYGQYTITVVDEEAGIESSVAVQVVEDASDLDPYITVLPPTVEQGESTEVTGSDFEPGTEVEVQLTDSEGNAFGEPVAATVEEDGGFVVDLPVSADTEPGDYIVSVTDAETGEELADAPLTVTEVVYSPEITVPEEASPGDEIDIIGEGFDPEQGEVGVSIEDQDGNRVDLGELPVDENGDLAGQVTLPEDLDLGDYTIVIVDPDSGDDLADGPITIVEPEIDPGDYDPVLTAPDEATAGEEITVTGEGYRPDSTVIVELFTDPEAPVYQFSEVEVDGEGNFSHTFTVPEELEGEYTIQATDSEVPEITDGAPVTIVAEDDDEDIIPSIILDPTEVEPGESTTVTGEDFEPNLDVELILIDSEGDPVGDPLPATTDEEGNLTSELTVPEDAAPGQYLVVVTEPGAEDALAAAPLTVTEPDDEDPVFDPSISAPESAEPGETISVEGEGFDPEQGEVEVVISDPETGEVIAGPETGTVDENGDLVVDITVPEGTEPGDYVIEVQDPETGETIADTGITISEPEDEDPIFDPSITVPEEAAPGDEIDIIGEGFNPEQGEVGVSIEDQDGNRVDLGELPVDEDGNIDGQVTLPEDLEDGDYTIIIVDPETGEDLAEAPITITDDSDDEVGTGNETIAAAPDTIAAGETTTVTGEGFEPGSVIDLEVRFDETTPVFVPGVAVDDEGGFSETVEVPADQPEGEYTVVAVDPETSTELAETGLTVTEPGLGDPGDYSPSIAADPTEVEAGAQTTITGEDFTPGSAEGLLISAEGGDNITVPPFTVGEEGMINQALTIPEDTELGGYTLQVTDPTFEENTATVDLTVVAPGDDDDDDDVTVDPNFRVSPETVEQGGFTVGLGGNWTPESTVTLQLTDGSGNPIGETITVEVDEDGLFTETIPVPADVEPGNYVVTATDGEETLSHPLTVEEATGDDDDDDDPERPDGPEQPGIPEDEPGFITDPTNPEPGEEINIEGENFDPELGEVDVVIEDEDGNRTTIGALPVDEDGNINGPVTIPQDTVPGDYDVIIVDQDTGEDIADAPITVIPPGWDDDDDDDGTDEPVERDPEIAISPNEVEAGDNIAIGGGHWEPGSTVTVVITDNEGNAISDPVSFTADEEGLIQGVITVPEGTEPGEYTVVASDEQNRTATDALTVIEATPPDDGSDDDDDEDRNPGVVITPDPVEPGEEIIIEGDDFEPGTEVDVIIEDEDGNVIVEQPGVEVDEDGNFEITVPIPEGTDPGDYTVIVSDPETGETIVEEDFTVVPSDEDDDDDEDRNPGVVITPDPVEPGEEIIIEGDDFEPGTEVDVIIEDEDGNVIVEQPGVEVDEDGTFEITVPIPEGTDPGDYTVIVSDPETGEPIVEQGFTVAQLADDGTGPALDDGTGDGTGPGSGDGTDGGLAVTGTGMMGLAAAAFFLLLAGVGAYVIARGRRLDRHELE